MSGKDDHNGGSSWKNASVSAPTVCDRDDLRDPATMRTVCDIVAGGGSIVLPTDTVYGIGTTADDAGAVSRVLALKGRGRQMPPPVLVPNAESLGALCSHVPDSARRLVERFWPGPLTLILTAAQSVTWDLGETHGTLALRMPDHEVPLSIMREIGPLAVTSANLTGEEPAVTCPEALGYFGNSVDVFIDGGPTPGPTPSTIVDLSTSSARITRAGALPISDIENVMRG